MAVRQAALSDERIRHIAGDVLSTQLGRFGYKTLAIEEDEDFDGVAILRMVAEVENKVPAKELIDTLLIVQGALENEGEDRTVFLSTHVPGSELLSEEDEE